MPAQNYVLLERIELNASAASVTFSNIPQTGYTDLKVVMSARCDNASVLTVVNTIFNGSTSGYSGRYLEGNGASASSNVGSTSALTVVGAVGASATASTFSNVELYIPNYTSNTFKSVSSDQVTENNATTAYADLYAYLWSNTAAINSITMTPASSANFVANSTFSLYGLAALGTTPTVAPKAVGGNITTDGTYWYHTFLTTGAFVPQVGLTADVLVVAGGGGSGSSRAGGGGAGGVFYAASNTLTANSSYTCTIGAGGAGGASGTGARGTNGVNSSFTGLTAAVGGGGGGGAATGNGLSGGSGGGATNNTVAAGTSGQGNAGGQAQGSTGYLASAGGGGAGAVGGNATGDTAPGNGGNGTAAYSSWGLATTTGQNVSGTVYYAGGGGGGKNATGGGTSTGGFGGGGAGTNVADGLGAAGTANTGGGGGAGTNTTVGVAGSAGGSGIVIIRYPVA